MASWVNILTSSRKKIHIFYDFDFDIKRACRYYLPMICLPHSDFLIHKTLSNPPQEMD